MVVSQHGEVVAERYRDGIGPETTLPSWSVAKSVLHAAIGVLVRDGRLDLDVPAAVPQWTGAADPRRTITPEHLLRMASGLAFVEDYVDDAVSDVIAMLFGAGRDDMAGFAADYPLAHPPGSVWSYSSGTSNILSGIVADIVGRADAYLSFLHDSLLGPIGMIGANPKLDGAGTWVASSFVYATARDFARLGLLYLRDGLVDGARVLPEGWVDHARRPTAGSAGTYGAHWWIPAYANDPLALSANGYEGQLVLVVPRLGLVVVRLGSTPASDEPAVEAFAAEVVSCFDEPSA